MNKADAVNSTNTAAASRSTSSGSTKGDTDPGVDWRALGKVSPVKDQGTCGMWINF